MEKINWPKIIEEESDNIIDALEALFNESCCLNADPEICQVIKIDREGTLIHHTIAKDTISSAVWSGDAIELARLAWFNPLDNVDEAEVISDYLTKDEWQAFSSYLNGERPTLKKLRQWNVAVADRCEKKFIEKYIADNAPVWAAKKMEEIRKHAGEYGREASRQAEMDDLGKS